MEDYQKDRLNRLMRDEWESACSHFVDSANPTLTPEESIRHAKVSAEKFAWVNGARETLEILGHEIRYEDNRIPQIK